MWKMKVKKKNALRSHKHPFRKQEKKRKNYLISSCNNQYSIDLYLMSNKLYNQYILLLINKDEFHPQLKTKTTTNLFIEIYLWIKERLLFFLSKSEVKINMIYEMIRFRLEYEIFKDVLKNKK